MFRLFPIVSNSMKSRIWQMATVGVLCVSVSGQLLADERGDGGWQARPQGEATNQPRPNQHGNNLPIQQRPDRVQQTQSPNRGGNQNWHAGGYNLGADNRHPNDQRWAGRPSGHGNGWGPGRNIARAMWWTDSPVNTGKCHIAVRITTFQAATGIAPKARVTSLCSRHMGCA